MLNEQELNLNEWKMEVIRPHLTCGFNPRRTVQLKSWVVLFKDKRFLGEETFIAIEGQLQETRTRRGDVTHRHINK